MKHDSATRIVFAVCLLLSGCGDRGAEVESAGYNGALHKEGKAFSYGVNCLTLNKRPFLLVFNQGFIGAGSPKRNGFNGRLTIHDSREVRDERSVEYSCTTKNGING